MKPKLFDRHGTCVYEGDTVVFRVKDKQSNPLKEVIVNWDSEDNCWYIGGYCPVECKFSLTKREIEIAYDKTNNR